MIKIQSDKTIYNRTLMSGRQIKEEIWVNRPMFDDEIITIGIQATNLAIQDVPEFIKAVELAAMIANDELEIG